MKTCYTTQLKLQLVATRSSTSVFIILFNFCLKVHYSWTFLYLIMFDHLSTWWPIGVKNNMTLIEVAIFIEHSYLSF